MRAPVDPDQEARRLACLLTNLLKLTGLPLRSAEEVLGLGRSGLSKLRNGEIRLQVRHLVAVLDLAEVSPARFFQMAYPKEPLTRRVKRELWRTRILLFDGDREPEETPGLAARLRRAFLRIFSRILRDEGFDPSLEKPPKP
jgi:transcriptional regulator with XRE-family HTH domain